MFRKNIYKKLIIVVIGLATVAGILGFLEWRGTINFFGEDHKKTISQKPVTNPINLKPPTETDKQDVDNAKQSITNQSSSASTTNEKTTVSPVISYAGVYESNVEISAYVPGVVESGGTCNVIISLDNKTISRTTSGTANVTNTSCPTFIIPASDLAAGSWQAKVAYDSKKATGVSETKTIEVSR